MIGMYKPFDITINCDQFEFLEGLKRAYLGSVVQRELDETQQAYLQDIMAEHKTGFGECWKLRFDFVDPDYFVVLNREACSRDPVYLQLRGLLREMGCGGGGPVIDPISEDRIMVYLALYRMLGCPDSRDSYEEPSVFFDDHPSVSWDHGKLAFTAVRIKIVPELSAPMMQGINNKCKTTIESVNQ